MDKIFRDSVIQADIEALIQVPIMKELKGKKVMVTGATGLIGSQIVKLLCAMNYYMGTDITVYALYRSEERCNKILGECKFDCNFIPIKGDINALPEIEGDIDYLIHGANSTSSVSFINNPVETLWTIVQGANKVLELAKRKHTASVVFLSSLEVYGVTSREEALCESDFGYLDCLPVRSSYSEGKRAAECLCSGYAKEYGIDVKIARLTQTFGPGVERSDKRVFAQFADSILSKKDIVLHTAGDTVRSYLYTRDAVEAIIYILCKGEKGNAYNISNEKNTISIKEMAELLIHLFPDSNSKVIIDTKVDSSGLGYNPVCKTVLKTDKLQKLGWRPKVELSDMFQSMIHSMREAEMK